MSLINKATLEFERMQASDAVILASLPHSKSDLFE